MRVEVVEGFIFTHGRAGTCASEGWGRGHLGLDVCVLDMALESSGPKQLKLSHLSLFPLPHIKLWAPCLPYPVNIPP